MTDINFFAKTNFRNEERVFGIKRDDRRRHMYAIGKTGMGKSNMMENMAIQDIRNGEGVCYIDPHGEGAEKMLKAIPANRINDVVYFNPADTEFPVAFNILESVDEDKKNLVASGMMGVFKKIWPDVWSPRMEYILNNTILALLDYPGSTMMGVNRMMSDGAFRKRVYPKIKDPVVKSFWLNEFDKWEDKFRKEAVAAIQNKVGQFLSASLIRHIVGQSKSTIDIPDIMNNKKILIVNLSKGRIGEDSMRLLGGMIVTKIQLAAMGRVEIPEEERKDFYLYVDEFQNFATESFANILSEARKYKLNLILAHQYINQLVFDGNATVRDAVFGNVGTIISFRVGAEDAEHLEKEFEPVFMMNDIVNLNKYTMYLKLMIDGVAGDAFSANSLPPLDLSDTAENEAKAITASRERYGKSRAEIEEKIIRWSGMDMEEASLGTDEDDGSFSAKSISSTKELPKIVVKSKTVETHNNASASAPVPASKNNIAEKITQTQTNISVLKTEKTMEMHDNASSDAPVSKTAETHNNASVQMHETICKTCEEKVLVPFKPDPNRPAFCKECLKDYQRKMAIDRERQSKMQSQIVQKKTMISHPADDNSEPKNISVNNIPMSLSQMSHIAPKKFKSNH